MGRKGDALRAAKKQAAVYHFTAEQLSEHDRQDSDFAVQRRKEEINENVRKEWESRAREFASADMNENFMNAVAYMFAIPCRVLIEQFGWTPIEGHRFTKHNRLVRFCDAVIKEIDGVASNKDIGIQEYAVETYKMYGVRFQMEQEE